MSSKTHTYATLTCDGCGTVLGKPGEYPSILAVRQAAFTLGWKAIPKRTSNDRKVHLDLDNPNVVTRLGRLANDQCPGCEVKPEEYKGNGSGKGGRSWWNERIKALHAENERLKAELYGR